MTFTHTSVQLVDADLNEVEQRFNFKFANEFREHYLKCNGGQPDKNLFADANGICIVHDFFPIKTSAIATLCTLETSVQWLKLDQPLIPTHLVPFADDPFGNLFCFSIRDKDRGAIYWLKMEGQRKADGDFLCSSLVAFLDKLKAATI